MSFWPEKRDNRRHSTTSFNEKVVVEETRVIKCYKFYHFAIRRRLNLVNEDNSSYFFCKKSEMKLSGVSFFACVNTLNQILYVAVILVLESKVL